jgi:molecular chaperone IbpA
MMSIDYSPLFRSTVGFDRLMRLLEESMQWSEGGNGGYPPYNIEKLGQDHYRVTLAVAGFGERDLSVHVRENALLVEGKKNEPEGETAYLHRGIAGRSFKRQFQLADHVKVTSASLQNGLLVIDLVQELPEAMKPRRIEISAKPSQAIAGTEPRTIEGSQEAA